MTAYSVAQAKDSLPRLIDKALAGEEVVITRRGRPVARLNPADPRPAQASAYQRLIAGRDELPPVSITSVELLHAMHEEESARERERGQEE